MTAPGDPASERDGAAEFASEWAAQVFGLTLVPMTWREMVDFLHGLTVRLAAMLLAPGLEAAAAAQVGVDLVAAKLIAPEALARTVTVLGGQLLPALGLAGDDTASARLEQIIETLSVAHCRVVRDLAMDEQEIVLRSAMRARREAEDRLRAEQARARHAALHDPLTGLPNRGMFADHLDRVFAGGGTGRAAVCLLDLDNFRPINDSLGPAVGDRLLVELARRLGALAAERGWFLSRVDGQEFAVLLEQTGCPEDAAKVADKVLSAVGEPFHVDGQELTVRASIGIFESPIAVSTGTEALRSARTALHWAQHDGGGRWMLFDRERSAAQVRRYRIGAAMPGALARGEFRLEYQPLVHLATGRIAGHEALARWTDPELGTVPPDTFIPLAEDTGLIVALGKRLLTQACIETADRPHRTRQPPFVSVNLAAQQIRQPGIVADIAAVLDSSGLPPDRLQLEITESVAVDESPHATRSLQALVALGVRLAIDDFGTGHANHAYLHRLPVHGLKLDASFIRALNPPGTGSKVEAILANLISLGHTLGLTVTAEGVESPAQVDLLRTLGCDLGQGWALG
ncbi:MAG: bifunctional diguanylate cyclase/phosphodiesterase [Micromonosporaceae bacterium]|nr:bifunctional diguanylate cyclase/phosphodiesterase [Micromonosporaceae bacterium]